MVRGGRPRRGSTLLAELAEDEDCPVEYVGTDDDAVRLTSPEAADRYLGEW